MEIIIVTGPPYSGKGTQCSFIEKITGFNHVSTGDYCRKEKESNSLIGLEIKKYEEKGELVPDAIMNKVLENIFNEFKDSKGIVLDGFPRTLSQASDLVEIISEKNLAVAKVVNIKVAREELLKRANERAKISSRQDDKDINVHERRIVIFEQESVPAIDFLNEHYTMISVVSDGTIAQMQDKIKKVFGL